MKVMIIGSTSGIGLALALHYLERGDTVAVCGRDLQSLPPDLPARHPLLHGYQFDIADRQAVAHAIDAFCALAASPQSGQSNHWGLDLLIVSAGVYFNTRSHKLDEAATLAMLRTNVSGLGHAFELAAGKMLPQHSGHLVAVSSIAGLLHDYPGASLYSATKRSVLSVCETYRIGLKPFSIAVTAIVPGYVDTARLRALNAGDASTKPFLMPESEAIKRIATAIEQRQEIVIFPWQMRWLVALLNRLPRTLLRLRR